MAIPAALALSSDCGDEARPRRRKRQAQRGKRICAAAGAVTKPVTLRDGWTLDFPELRPSHAPEAAEGPSNTHYSTCCSRSDLLSPFLRRVAVKVVHRDGVLPSWLEITIRQRARRGRRRRRDKRAPNYPFLKEVCRNARRWDHAREVTRSNRGNLSMKT